MTEPATSSPPRHLTPPRDIRPPRLQFPRPLVRPAFPSPPNFAAFGDVGARQSCPAFCLWFAKMISDAKSLRISDIHINVRAWAGKACNIVLLKGMSREKFSPSAQCRHFFLGIQPTRLNVHSYFREWSWSGPRSYFVSACEAEKRFFPVVPFLLP